MAFQGVFHFRAAIDAVDAAFQIRRSRAVDALHGHRLLDAQLPDRLKETGAVQVDAAPGFLAQENNQPVAGVIKVVLPGHGTGRQPFLKGGRRTESVVGAGHLKGIAQGGNAVAQVADRPRPQFLNQIAGQAAGNAAAVRPLPPPAGNQILGFRFLVED